MKKRMLKLLFWLVVIFPLLFLLVLSFGQKWVFPAILPGAWAATPWGDALGQGGALGNSLLTSLLIAAIIATLSTGVGFFTARSINRSSRAEQWIQLAYLPYIFSPVILAACLQYYFLRLQWSGTVGGVMVAQFFISYPFAVILLRNFWNPQLRATEQTAATLGAAPVQVFWKVLLPLARGPLMVVFFQTFLISWFEYGLTQLIGVGKVQTLPLKVFDFVNEANIYYAAMASCLLALPPILLLWINKKVLFVARS